MSDTNTRIGKRLSESQKRSDDFKWYKEWIDMTSNTSEGIDTFFISKSLVDRRRDININYELYDGKIRKEDFQYLYNPYGVDEGQPVEFTHKDIISKRIKTIEGLEMSRPFGFRVYAVNEEATTRREQEETKRIQEYVIQQIMQPLQQQMQQEADAQMQQMQMNLQQLQQQGAPQEQIMQAQQEMQQAQQQMEQQAQQQMDAMTPEEVKRYMKREHQDPSEVLMIHLLNYLKEKQDVERKFKEAWRDMAIAPFCCVYVGEINKEPSVERVDPRGFRYKPSNESNYIEDGEWASYERYMTISEISREYGDELSNDDIERLTAKNNDDWGDSIWLDKDYNPNLDRRLHTSGIRVVHSEWKDVKKIKFLRYVDLETGEENETIVPGDYRMDEDLGDISTEDHWIVTRYEGTRIGTDKYVRMREVPNQFRDLEGLQDKSHCKLSYKGIDMRVSLVDRMKPYQLLYDIFMYRIEMLAAGDKGRALMINDNLKPDNLSMEQFLYYLDTLHIGFLNNNTKEGDKAVPFNVGEAVKEIDRSASGDIQKYQMLLEWIDTKCGESVGMNPQLLGQIQQNEAVSNANGAINNSVNTLEHYFYYFNIFKKNVLIGLIEAAKSIFMKYQPKVLSYVMDDMSLFQLQPDYDLLDESTYGISLTNNTQTNQILDMIKQLCHAALQNQVIDLSDVIKVMKSDNLIDAQEILQTSEERKRQQMNEQQQQAQQAQQQLEEYKQQKEVERLQLQSQAKMEQIKLQGEIDLKLKEIDLQRQVILAQGFDTDKDRNNNGVPDVAEQAKIYLDEIKANQKERELALKERQQQSNEEDSAHKRRMDEKKIELEKEKIKKMGQNKSNKG